VVLRTRSAAAVGLDGVNATGGPFEADDDYAL
jgi:hypothetical protein